MVWKLGHVQLAVRYTRLPATIKRWGYTTTCVRSTQEGKRPSLNTRRQPNRPSWRRSHRTARSP